MKKIVGLMWCMWFGISLSASAQSGFYIPPHIQNIQQDSATLIWESNTEEASSVSFGVEGSDLSMIATGDTAKIHRVSLEGLKPATRYTYRVATGDDSQEATFITAPSTQDEITFIVVGDSRRWDNRWEETGMDQHVLQWDADVYLTMGDLVRDGHQYEQWPEHFKRFSALTDEKWFVTARGNHEGSLVRDTDKDWFGKYHELPGDGEPYAYFDWGNTHFMLVSYESTGREKDWTNSAKWLDKHLEGVEQKYTIVAQHFPVYCTGYYGTTQSRKEPGVNAKHFRDVMDKHDVTLNAAGHTHIYERHYPLRDNKRDDRTGTWYVVNGGDINANFPDWWSAVTDNRAEHAKPTYTVYQMKQDRVIARTFAFNVKDNAIEQVDYFIIWEDESIPAKRLAALSTAQGDELLGVMDDLAAMLYAPAAKALLPYLEHTDIKVRHTAAKALGILGNGDIAQDLLPYVSNDDVVLARNAARSIEAAMPASVEKKVIALLKDESVVPEARYHLVGALHLRGDAVKATNAFIDVLSSQEVTGELRNRLAYALGETATDKNTKRLIRLFAKEESPYVTMSLAYALNSVTGKRNNLSGNGPVAKSEPGKRQQFIDRWTK